MSLFLFRKVLPAPEPDIGVFLEKVSAPSPEPDPLFMEYIRNEVPRIFPPGWDKGYQDQALSASISTSSCAELTRSRGGARMLSTDMGWEQARMDFVESVLTSSRSLLGDTPSRVVNVQSGGKWRTLTVTPLGMSRLRPLHKTIYNHLSRFKWLLRGDAKPSSFKDFCMKDGELFCSGDYESATDNLNSQVQKEILRLILQGTKHVPNGVIVDAMKSFSLNLTARVGEDQLTVQQQSGQMMGNLLSFPLLCLVNYLTFRFLVMDDSVPVRINGDDIVFRGSKRIVDRWMEGVQVSGLTLSRGKTLVDRRYFSLNSSLFKAKRDGAALIPFIRSKALFGVGDDGCPAGSLPGRFSSFCPGFFGSRRTRLRGIFFRENSGWIRQSGRSIVKGLGIPAKKCDIAEGGLWDRELQVLALGREVAPYIEYSMWANAPDGFRVIRVSKERKKELGRSPELKAALVDAAWKPAIQRKTKEWRESVFLPINFCASRVPAPGRRINLLARMTKQNFAKVRADLRKDHGSWNLSCIDSLDSWSRIKCCKEVSRDLFSNYAKSIERSYSVYVPVDHEVRMTSSVGSSFSFTLKQTSDRSDDFDSDSFNNRPVRGGVCIPPPSGLV